MRAICPVVKCGDGLSDISDSLPARDIKPANLLLDTAGTPWITDFGLAKAQDDVNLTQTGAVVGTVRYMSPERFAGAVCDVRGDVYSLGASLYELTAFRPAFAANDLVGTINAISRNDAVPLGSIDPRIPIDLQTIIEKAMHKDPNRRYRSR